MDEVHFTLTGEDFWHLQRHALARQGRRQFILVFIFLIAIAAILLLNVPFATLKPDRIMLLLGLILLAALVILALIFGLTLLILRLNASGTTKSLRKRGVHIASLDEQGFRLKNELGDSLTYWRAFKAITENKHCIYFQLDSPGSVFTAFLVPKRAFESPSQAERFVERARSYWREQTV
jgi:small-conductance mechanosensitive channel